VLFFSLPPSIGALSMTASGFVGAHPELIRHLAEHVLVHSVYSHIRGGRKVGAPRRQRRKIANRRRRWFVDNIIMHHKRLHDKNRQSAVDDIRKKALEKREALKKKPQSLQQALTSKDDSTKWRDRTNGFKERSMSMRDRVDSRRLRARSRWASISTDVPFGDSGDETKPNDAAQNSENN